MCVNLTIGFYIFPGCTEGLPHSCLYFVETPVVTTVVILAETTVPGVCPDGA